MANLRDLASGWSNLCVMEICYINLAERADRDAAFLKLNSHLTGLRKIAAVNGRLLQVDELIRDGTTTGPLPSFSAASLANAISHKRIWEHYSQKASGVTVAEDDAIFNLRFEDTASSVLAKLDPDWDLMFWGWNFDSHVDVEIIPGLKRCIFVFDPAMLGTKIEEFRKIDCETVALRLFGAHGTVAYSASPKGLKLLLQHCFPLRHELILMSSINKPKAIWNCSLDVTMSKYFPILKAYVCVPPLVWTENDKSVSDVFPAT